MVSTVSTSFDNFYSTDSFDEMEDIILRKGADKVVIKCFWDNQKVESIARNLIIWDIKLRVEKGSEGWVFYVERGVYF